MFKRSLFAVISVLLITFTLLSGGVVSATNENITIEDLIKMTDKELSVVPQDTITTLLNKLSEAGEKVWGQYDGEDLERIGEQWLSNEHDVVLQNIAQKPWAPTRASSFNVGQSITVNWAEDGDCDESGWGFWSGDEDYDVSSETGESWVLADVIGGGLTWARTGHNFDVGGSGYGYYRIDMDCAWICTSLNWGTCTLSLLVEKWLGGNYSSTTFEIDEYSAGIGSEHDESFEYSTPSYIRLDSGGDYRISLLVETEANAINSVAGADCMSDYYDSVWDYLHLEYSP